MAKRSQGWFKVSVFFFFFKVFIFSTAEAVVRPECVPASSQQTISLLLKWIHYIWRSGLIFNLEHTEKKNPLGFIFPASAILLWVCSEICFHQADSIRELGNEKSAMESDGGEEECGGGRVGLGVLCREEQVEMAERERITLI